MKRTIDYLSGAVFHPGLSCSTPNRVTLLQRPTSPAIRMTFSTTASATAFTRYAVPVRSTLSNKLMQTPIKHPLRSTQQKALALDSLYRSKMSYSWASHITAHSKLRSAPIKSNNSPLALAKLAYACRDHVVSFDCYCAAQQRPHPRTRLPQDKSSL